MAKVKCSKCHIGKVCERNLCKKCLSAIESILNFR